MRIVLHQKEYERLSRGIPGELLKIHPTIQTFYAIPGLVARIVDVALDDLAGMASSRPLDILGNPIGMWAGYYVPRTYYRKIYGPTFRFERDHLIPSPEKQYGLFLRESIYAFSLDSGKRHEIVWTFGPVEAHLRLIKAYQLAPRGDNEVPRDPLPPWQGVGEIELNSKREAERVAEELDAMRFEAEEAHEANRMLGQDLTELQSERDELREIVEVAQEAKRVLGQDLDELRSERDELLEVVEVAQEAERVHGRYIVELRSERNELRADLDQAQEANRRLGQDITALQCEGDELRNNVEQGREANRVLGEDITKLQCKGDKLRKDIEEAQVGQRVLGVECDQMQTVSDGSNRWRLACDLTLRDRRWTGSPWSTITCSGCWSTPRRDSRKSGDSGSR